MFIIILLISAYSGSLIHLISANLPARLLCQWKMNCLETLAAEYEPIQAIKMAPATLFKSDTCCSQCKNHHSQKYLYWLRKLPLLSLFSYLLSTEKCSICKNSPYLRRFTVEIITISVAFITISLFGITFSSLLLLLLFFGLITLSLIDLDYQLLPDVIVLPLLWLGLIVNYASLFTDLHSALLGAVGGYSCLWLIFHLHYQLRGKVGMGHGDFKLLALLGAWFGWQLLPSIIFIASISGTLVGGLKVISKQKNLNSTIAFGPHLAIAGSVSYFFQVNANNIGNLYLRLFQW